MRRWRYGTAVDVVGDVEPREFAGLSVSRRRTQDGSDLHGRVVATSTNHAQHVQTRADEQLHRRAGNKWPKNSDNRSHRPRTPLPRPVWAREHCRIIAKFHYTDTDTDTDTDFFAAKLRWVRAGPCPCSGI